MVDLGWTRSREFATSLLQLVTSLIARSLASLAGEEPVSLRKRTRVLCQVRYEGKRQMASSLVCDRVRVGSGSLRREMGEPGVLSSLATTPEQDRGGKSEVRSIINTCGLCFFVVARWLSRHLSRGVN